MNYEIITLSKIISSIIFAIFSSWLSFYSIFYSYKEKIKNIYKKNYSLNHWIYASGFGSLPIKFLNISNPSNDPPFAKIFFLKRIPNSLSNGFCLKNENKWLNRFNKINNENKHSDLVEQVRTETKQVSVTNPAGGSVSWGPGVTFGAGVQIMGVPIDPQTQLPVPNNIVKTEIITWVDFKFNNVDVSALWLLKESLKQVNSINSQITNFL